MPFQIIQDNMINIKAEAIVTSTNTEVMIGEGLDKAIHDAAGPELFIERKKIGEINTGEAYISSAFHLNAKYVIHTVGPKWIDGRHNEKKLLNNCYLNALQLALDNQCESIAFPLISSGLSGYPKDEALFIAMGIIKDFLEVHEMMIFLVIYSKESFGLTESLSYAIDKAISMKFAMSSEPIIEYDRRVSLDEIVDIRHIRDSSAPHKIKHRTLDELIYKIDDTFSETLLKLIDQKGLSDREVYNKANIDRKHFSKIRNKNYHPSKRTALALAVALQLNLDETKDLIKRAGYALSNSNLSDIIIEYCIKKKYDIYIANMILFEYEQDLLGSVT
jgi:O-acetyl-ADP-ribose deacetylase